MDHTPHITAETPLKPTKETYDRLQQAFDHFNKALFGSTLPNPLFTYQRRRNTYGYFSGGRFKNEDGRPADEIALNPALMADRPIREVLATLVHEMVHQWQRHDGEPGRGRYHNRQWAEKMKEAGLQPSDTGMEGGKETGETVGHYIIPGGAFDAAADRLLGKGFAIAWAEVRPAQPADGAGAETMQPAPKGGKRVRYSCPACGLKAWAKHDAQLVCGADMQALTAAP